MKLCPECGAILTEVIGGYYCFECDSGMFEEEEVVSVKCPYCDEEMTIIDDEYYCYFCRRNITKDRAVYSKEIDVDDDDDFYEPDYDSMINNGDNICLNCTYWSTSPYGAAHGMVCRRGYPTAGPGDSCSSFVKSHHFASYGSDGQYQFNETRRHTANKLNHWKNNR